MRTRQSIELRVMLPDLDDTSIQKVSEFINHLAELNNKGMGKSANFDFETSIFGTLMENVSCTFISYNMDEESEKDAIDGAIHTARSYKHIVTLWTNEN